VRGQRGGDGRPGADAEPQPDRRRASVMELCDPRLRIRAVIVVFVETHPSVRQLAAEVGELASGSVLHTLASVLFGSPVHTSASCWRLRPQQGMADLVQPAAKVDAFPPGQRQERRSPVTASWPAVAPPHFSPDR
jgi:hypothetical protein